MKANESAKIHSQNHWSQWSLEGKAVCSPCELQGAPPQIKCKLGETAGSISLRLTLPKLHLATYKLKTDHSHFTFYLSLVSYLFILLFLSL